MAQLFTGITVDGFRSGEFDFAAALQRQSSEVQNQVASVIGRLVEAEADPEAGFYWSVTVVGHSDLAGSGTEAERRAQELTASTNRAVSTVQWLIDELGRGLAALGRPAPTSLADPANVGISWAPAGAGDLVKTSPATEADRLKNRRVRLLVISFGPFAFSAEAAEQADVASRR